MIIYSFFVSSSLLAKRKVYDILFISWVNLFIYCIPSVINIFEFISVSNEYKLIFGSFISFLLMNNKNELSTLLHSVWIKLFSGGLLFKVILLLKIFVEIIILLSEG